MTGQTNLTRRDLLRKVLGAALGAATYNHVNRLDALAKTSDTRSSLPTRPLGNTGYQVGLFSLGGQAALEDGNKFGESVEIINKALDLGVNFLDTASLYGNGASELCIGEVMRTRRKQVFLASKTYDRSYDGSMRTLEASLKRLQTDHLDLWQLHNVQTHNEVDFILSREGAIRAIEKAREEGIVRFAGITGHKDPFVVRRAIELYPFDAILIALNAADNHGSSFIRHLLPLAMQKRMGIIGMKVTCCGRIFRDTGVRTMEQAMRFVLTLPVSTVIVGISNVHEVEENVRLARTFTPCTSAEMAGLEQLTEPYFADALWYRDKM